jgi:hypothetical protein
MIGYILTNQEYEQLQGQFYSQYQFFNCVKDINDVFFLMLSNQDKAEIINTEWDWILTLPEGEYVPPPSPFPPSPTGSTENYSGITL